MVWVFLLGGIPLVGCSEDGPTAGSCGIGGGGGDAWGVAQRIDNAYGHTLDPQVAMDAQGNAMAVWRLRDIHTHESSRIWSNRYTPDGCWAAAVVIDNEQTPAHAPQIAMNPKGDAIAVWQQSDGVDHDDIWSNRYTPASGWGTPELIGDNDDNAFYPDVAIDPKGNAIAVWKRHSYRYPTESSIWSNRYAPAEGWGAMVRIDHQEGLKGAPHVVMDPQGNAITVWMHSNHIWSTRYTPTEGWSGPVRLEEASGISKSPRVAVDAQGNAIAVWARSDRHDSAEQIWSNRYTPEAGWGAALRIEDSDTSASGPDVAMDAEGNAISVWRAGLSDGSVWANRYVVGRGWQTPVAIDDNDSYAGSPRIAMDPLGNATAVWVRWYAGVHIWSKRFTIVGGWGAATRIDNDDPQAGKPQVAMDPQGNATVVWEQSDRRYIDVTYIWANQFR